MVTLQRQKPSSALRAFVDEVGDPSSGAVTVVGAGNHWQYGGELEGDVRVIRAPSGVVQFEPSEMIVRCGAGTSYQELNNVLASANQCCPLDPVSPDSTIGGLLAAGMSGHRRLRFGATRDLLLEAQFVDANGHLLRAGAPVVKNVSGYDVCRLLVGSFGTLGLIGEVVLRCRPAPELSRWCVIEHHDPIAIRARLFQPSSVFWDGARVWILLEGYQADIEHEINTLQALGAVDSSSGPSLPSGGRLSVDPNEFADLAPEWTKRGKWIAEIGVGTVHTDWQTPRRTAATPLERSIKHQLDPARRFSPGRLEL
jgi:FAD/FMN-containing dehydrogenase